MKKEDKTIKVSEKSYQRLKAKKQLTGASIRFMIDLALDALWGVQKKGNKNG